VAGGAPADVDHLRDGETARAYVRPHDVRLTTAAENGSVPANVERITNMGWTSKIHLRLPDGQVLLDQLPNEDIVWVRPGAKVYAALRDAKVFSVTTASADAVTDWPLAEV